jgi:hypothetical protein
MAKQGRSSLELHQEIYIALGVGLASCYRAEDPHILRAVFGRNSQNLLAPGFQEVIEVHLRYFFAFSTD